MLVRVKCLKNLSDKDPVALPYELHVDLLAADYHHIVGCIFRTFGHQFLHAVNDDTPLFPEACIARQHDIGSFRQRSASGQAFERRSAHNDDFAFCFFFEISEVSRKVD